MQTSMPEGVSRAYRIAGMHCMSCVARVQSIAEAAGFSDSTVSLSEPQLRTYGPGHEEVLRTQLIEAGYAVQAVSGASAPPTEAAAEVSYVPLAVVVGLAAVGGILLAAVPIPAARWGVVDGAMAGAMALFFLFAGLLKAIDLSAFVAGFRRYDPVAQRLPAYAQVYPLLEWGAAAGYVWFPHSTAFNVAIALWMGFNAAVAYRTWKQPGAVACACLGGVLRVPVGPVTTVEYGAMAVMALFMAVL